ncbi:MAG TPA: dihydrofolate reductase family protein [Actinomycetota bacterium]|nr:dihydrofolate reductase family protein [Actinomycetota bacterium]
MSKVTTQASMSLDGFISGPNESGFEHIFEWYGNGNVTIPTANPEMPAFQVSQASADYLGVWDDLGAMVVGRRLFDITNGWDGNHPIGRDVPIFVVTHSVPMDWTPKYDDTSFTFVTDGLESAIAQAKAVAGNKSVVVGPGSIVGQALESGLIDEIKVDLVPVLIGGGVRFLESLATAPVTLDTPRVIEGDRVTHLIFKVQPAS